MSVVKSVKIGIFTNNYLPNPYGVMQSIESFRKQFEKLGHQVFIFSPQWKGYVDSNPNVFRYPSVDIEIKFRFPLAIPYSLKIHKILKNLKLDLIHSQHPNLLGSEASKWARKKNIPLVFTWHTLYDQYTNFFPFLPKRMAANWIIKKAVNYANNADCVITPTESVKNIIKNWGVMNKNIIAIPSGVEEEMYQNADGNIIRKKFGIKDDEVLLLLISRLTAEKNVEFLFAAIVKVLKKYANAKFLIAGDGYLVPQLKSMAKDSNLEERIIFEGIVEKTEIKNYYAAGDIFVYASKSETQGMIVSEAMYMGLPIVAVDATGSKDLIENNVNGFLIPENSPREISASAENDKAAISRGEEKFAEAVIRLIEDKNLRKMFSENSARIAREKYTDRICAEKMLAVYDSLIKNE